MKTKIRFLIMITFSISLYCLYVTWLALCAPFPENKFKSKAVELRLIWTGYSLFTNEFARSPADFKEFEQYVGRISPNYSDNYIVCDPPSNNFVIISRYFDRQYKPPFGVFFPIRGWPVKNINRQRVGITSDGKIQVTMENGSVRIVPVSYY